MRHHTQSGPFVWRNDARGAEQGFSVVDVAVALGVLALVITSVMGVMVTTMGLDAVNRETAVATASAHQVIERMEGVPLRDVFALFNETSLDDPPGVLEVPGNLFDVPGLSAGDPGTETIGEIVFPVSETGGVLREDAAIPALGLPMDLNGDGTVDANDHSQDYVVLPVTIRLSWNGVAGRRSLEVHTLLGQ